MIQPEPPASPASPTRAAADADPPDHGINLVSVLVALTVLMALVIGMFWGLPAWFGSSVINVTAR